MKIEDNSGAAEREIHHDYIAPVMEGRGRPSVTGVMQTKRSQL